jgi:hypothetical protein
MGLVLLRFFDRIEAVGAAERVACQYDRFDPLFAGSSQKPFIHRPLAVNVRSCKNSH